LAVSTFCNNSSSNDVSTNDISTNDVLSNDVVSNDVSSNNFSIKERFFVALAWLPKATVQAAIGPLALDNAKLLSSGKNLNFYNNKKLLACW
jgi:hypothetical protein